jgi:tRNA 5-methylaminomethyl-2-thiouridine biosynthesis bifunctional protein
MSDPFAIIEPAQLTWRQGNPASVNYGDVYFSDAGALAESDAVVIQGSGLPQRLQALAKGSSFVIASRSFSVSNHKV